MKHNFLFVIFILFFSVPLNINAAEPCLEIAACNFSALAIDLDKKLIGYDPRIDGGRYFNEVAEWYNSGLNTISNEYSECLDRNS